MGLLRNTATRRLCRGLALLLIGGGLLGAAAPVSEYQLKAVFLFNFAQFVEWPPSACWGTIPSEPTSMTSCAEKR
jgi:hypothetical protein